MSGHVTVAEIAARLGLAKTTVAHVLNGRAAQSRIRPETQRRVEEAARELGYRPNVSARAMRTGRFGCAALLQSLRAVYLPPGLLLGLTDELRRLDMHLAVAEMPEEAEGDEDYLPKVVRELAADGLLINMIVDIPPLLVEAVRLLRTPTIWININHPVDCVFPNDREAGRIATEHLLRLGHEKIAFVTSGLTDGDNLHYSVGDRRDGYAQAMRDGGQTSRTCELPRPPITAEDMMADGRVPDAIRLLSAPDRPTALLAYERESTLPLLLAAYRLGLRVPEDLSLIMFHEDKDTSVGVPITSVGTMSWVLGQQSVQMLREKMAAPDQPLPSRPIPPGFFEGGTCGPPRSLR